MLKYIFLLVIIYVITTYFSKSTIDQQTILIISLVITFMSYLLDTYLLEYFNPETDYTQEIQNQKDKCDTLTKPHCDNLPNCQTESCKKQESKQCSFVSDISCLDNEFYDLFKRGGLYDIFISDPNNKENYNKFKQKHNFLYSEISKFKKSHDFQDYYAFPNTKDLDLKYYKDLTEKNPAIKDYTELVKHYHREVRTYANKYDTRKNKLKGNLFTSFS
jgi:hypothetical protein